jgi:hypothetical protein
MAGYLPSSDAEFLAWAKNFSTYLSAHATDFGLTQSDVMPLSSAVTAFDTDLDQHVIATQESRAACQTKDTCRRSAAGYIRQLVRRIQANPAINNTQRELLGITVRGEQGNLNFAAASLTRPVGSADTSERLRHEIRYSDESTPTRRARPAWAFGCEVWCKIAAASEPTPLDPDAYQNLGLNTASPFINTLSAADVGRMAHYMLRWVGRDGRKGPWSEIISATIVG